MKTQTLLLLSHLGSASLAASAIAFVLQTDFSVAARGTGVAVTAIFVVLISWFTGAALKRGLRHLLRATAKSTGANPRKSSGIHEFDAAARQLSGYVQRWTEAAAGARQQTQDVEALLLQLDRRATPKALQSTSAGVQLRQALDGITRSVDADLHQVVNCAHEIWKSVEDIAGGADNQSDAATKTTTYVERVSTNIESVAQNVRDARGSVVTVRDAAQEATGCLTELTTGVEKLRVQMQANERNFRGLSDRSREIRGMIETISDIASRTDMLALNASIESVRAGEHGKGFAIVAEEVHRLAEQTAHAANEVAAMLDSTQLETQGAIGSMATERRELDREIERVQAMQAVIERVVDASNDSANHLADIPTSTDQQLGIMQEVLIAVEQVADVAKATRSHAEKARWTTKALTKMTVQFDSALSPLRGCGESTLDDVLEQANVEPEEIAVAR